MIELSKRLSLARTLTWITYIAFLITLLINGLQKSVPIVIHAFTLLPLLIFLPGMIKEHYKSLSMLCFVCLMYLTLITVNLFEPGRTILDVLEMIWVSTLFTAAMFFSRWKQRSLVSE